MREVKVRQMPPKPFRETAKKISSDRAAKKNKTELEPKSTGGVGMGDVQCFQMIQQCLFDLIKI